MNDPAYFQQQLLTWYHQHGRKDLPWQQARTPYKVWLSEIMLQQTQVSTVMPYFKRFMLMFPDVNALAEAELDHVLQLWTGLGYYARARNLHKSACIIHATHQGKFPADYDALLALPGIGESTAGAIMAQAYDQSFAILDGNVKRVLCRYHAISGWPGQSSIQKKLWTLAKAFTPTTQVADYTQAIMDLGATVCTRGTPRCQACSLSERCEAYQQGIQRTLPTPKPRKTLLVRQTKMLMLYNDEGEFLLYKRPPVGVWGGLWSFYECPIEEDVPTWCQAHMPYQVEVEQTWNVLRHTFSHFHLDITPVVVAVKSHTQCVMEAEATLWYNVSKPEQVGLSTPVRGLLDKLQMALTEDAVE